MCYGLGWEEYHLEKPVVSHVDLYLIERGLSCFKSIKYADINKPVEILEETKKIIKTFNDKQVGSFCDFKKENYYARDILIENPDPESLIFITASSLKSGHVQLMLEVECESTLDINPVLELFYISHSVNLEFTGSTGIDFRCSESGKSLMHFKHYYNVNYDANASGYMQFYCNKNCMYRGKKLYKGDVLSFHVTTHRNLNPYKIINLNSLPSIIDCVYVIPSSYPRFQFIYNNEISELETELKELDEEHFNYNGCPVHCRLFCSLYDYTQFLMFNVDGFNRTLFLPRIIHENDSVDYFELDIHDSSRTYQIFLDEVKTFKITCKSKELSIGERDKNHIRLMEDGFYLADKTVKSIFLIEFDETIMITAITEKSLS